MAPFTFAFGKEDIFSPSIETLLEIVAYFNTIVYMTDVILGFRKAFLNEKDGRECRDPKKIPKRYLKGFFIIDVLSGIPFDFFVSPQVDYSYFILFPLFKMLRLIDSKR